MRGTPDPCKREALLPSQSKTSKHINKVELVIHITQASVICLATADITNQTHPSLEKSVRNSSQFHPTEAGWLRRWKLANSWFNGSEHNYLKPLTLGVFPSCSPEHTMPISRQYCRHAISGPSLSSSREYVQFKKTPAFLPDIGP